MTAVLLARARDAGIQLYVQDGALRVRAPAPPPADLLAELSLHKGELLQLLAEPATDPAADPPDARPALARPRRPAGPPSEEMVDALAQALAARPGHKMTDPAKAMAYYRSDARRRLALLDDDLARGLLVGFWRHRGVR